mgnify:CR=1 FL=1
MGKTRTVGNGEGTLYYSDSLRRWIFQYFVNGKRMSIKQRNKESTRDFKIRVTKLKNELNTGSYIEISQETLKTIIKRHINQKFNDGITKGTSYKRDCETLQSIEKCCSDFIDKPIQKVSLRDLQKSKENMKEYSQSVINKMWRLLSKGFSIASSPSVRLITFNIMNDENLKRPKSNKNTKKVKPLTKEEREKLIHILDNEERNHKYRNIVKLEWITSMRIGEVLALSREDVLENKTMLHIHNTLTKDKDGNIILGEHTKTYNYQTGIDEGERYFPITSELKEIFNQELNKKITNIHNLLFWDYGKNIFISEGEVNSWLRRINEKYQISETNIHNHRLRHDRITYWKEQGMDMSAIQYLAGHVEGSTITDNVYIDVSHEYAFNELKKVN